MSFDGTPRSRAWEFLIFCDGLEAAGCAEYARRGRVVARDLIAAEDALDAGRRSARVALQERCERQQEIIGGRATA